MSYTPHQINTASFGFQLYICWLYKLLYNNSYGIWIWISYTSHNSWITFVYLYIYIYIYKQLLYNILSTMMIFLAYSGTCASTKWKITAWQTL